MPLETIIFLVFIGLLGLSIVKRLLWLAIGAAVIGLLIYSGAIELAFEFVKQTLIENPVKLTIG